MTRRDEGAPGDTPREKRLWTLAAVVLYAVVAIGAARVAWKLLAG